VSLWHCVTPNNMIPLIIESDDESVITQYLTDKYYLQNLVSQVRPIENSIGLPAIKYLIDRAKFTHPEKSTAVFLIYDGHLITTPGQNALLKTLEESRVNEQFIIVTPNHHLLLETIVSRCQIISLRKAAISQLDQSALRNFVGFLKSPSRNIVGSDEILADSPKDTLKQIINGLKQANRHLPTVKRVKIISLALECLSDLDRNINPKLAMDHFLLQSGKIIRKPAKMNPDHA